MAAPIVAGVERDRGVAGWRQGIKRTLGLSEAEPVAATAR
jgi:hypothetical protein